MLLVSWRLVRPVLCCSCLLCPEGPTMNMAVTDALAVSPSVFGTGLPSPPPPTPPTQARHIGGAVNYMAVTDALAVSPSVFGAGLAADDLILTLYFTTIYTLAKSIPPDLPSAAMAVRAETGGSETHAAATASAGGAEAPASPFAAPSSQAGQPGSTGGHGGGIEMKPIHVSGLRGQVAALGPDALVNVEWCGVLRSSVELRELQPPCAFLSFGPSFYCCGRSALPPNPFPPFSPQSSIRCSRASPP